MVGRALILSGPSGVGKDTVINAWREANPAVERVVAYTTRSPRPGEVDGVDYHFVTEEAFFEKANRGDFLEYKEVHGNFYATPLSDLHDMIAGDKIAILKIDVQGALVAMKRLPEAKSVFLLPPDKSELERRILERGTEAAADVARRLENARLEIALSRHYQHCLVNDSVDDVVAQLEEIVR